MRRLVGIALLGALLAALATGSAHAALGLLFSKTSAAPGDVVVVRTGGNGALLEAKKRGETKRWPLRVFMVANADVDAIRSTSDNRLKALGRLTVDRKGNGRLRFVTPNVPPGDYTTLSMAITALRGSVGFDLPAIIGVVLAVSFAIVAINLVVDLLYAWLDPRIRVT